MCTFRMPIWAFVLAFFWGQSFVSADDSLKVGELVVDPPTLVP